MDFIVSTEHNTSSAGGVWGHHAVDDLLIIDGEEITTKSGHYTALGLPPGTWIDWRYRAVDGVIPRFLEEIDLLSEGDLVDWDRERDAVTLSTVHGAKGLEFPVVFLVGLEEGTFPHYRASYRGTLDEERRLFYVGVTRAMEKLYLVHARRREINGELRMRDRSRFLRDLPREALEYGYS